MKMKLFLKRKYIVYLCLLVFILFSIRNIWKINELSNSAVENAPFESLTESMLEEPQELTSKKIDWHNYQKIKAELRRKGIGEHGKPAKNPIGTEQEEKQIFDVNGFNGYLSDQISVNRSIPDIRHPRCKLRKYLATLPTVSVVVPFHNEHWSTLLRTAHSVVNRSPKQLLKEIILVDDASTKSFLKEDLEKYLAANFTNVKVLRLKERSGLITARLAGAKIATADVLIFLDSHSEANVNWLPPLLEPIAINYKTAVCPFIDVIAFDTFEYRAQDEGARGAFDWEFFYKRLPLLPRDEENMPEPFESPVMAGGLFAISRKFFWELGGYDPGLDIWGGEQYELSFKIWQCGGRMLDAPCSRVGHIYRKFAPFPNPRTDDFVGKNYRRVAEVWMDEYAQYLYKRRPQYLKIDPGDLTELKAIRKKLNCKPFKWFMNQVAFDFIARYPPVDPGSFAQGMIKSVSNESLCIDANNGNQMHPLSLVACQKGSEINFTFSWYKDIRSSKRAMCWDLPNADDYSPIVLYECHLGMGNQLWRYDEENQQIKHGKGSSCVDMDPKTKKLFINHCNKKLLSQKWVISEVNKELLAKWSDVRKPITGPVQEF